MFISLLSPRGKGKEAVDYLRRLKPSKGITVQNIYATLGRYDVVLLFEATDIDGAMRFAIEVGTATDYTIETLAAVPVVDLSFYRPDFCEETVDHEVVDELEDGE